MAATSKDLRIVFMGTPEFATTILKKLVDENYNVVGCVTVPDKPAGRGRKIQESDVKKYAISKEIPLLQPHKLKSEEFLEQLSVFQADIFIVVAFRMLPEVVWKMPRMGTINLHGSLLPNYRGAAPINWAVINGEQKTGVTSFYINDKIDTGDVLLQEEMTIHENETAGEVHDRMMHLGADIILKTIDGIFSKELQPIAQKEISVKQTHPAPKIFKEDCKIDLTADIQKIIHFIHGLSPYPGAWLELTHLTKQEAFSFKIFRAKPFDEATHNKTCLFEDQKQLLLQLPKGTLILEEVQLQGKRKMNAKDFIAGFRPEEWNVNFN